MLIAAAALLLAQDANLKSVFASRKLDDCIKFIVDDAVMKGSTPESFPSWLEKLCGAERDEWMKAKNAADGEDADPEDSFYAAKARFARALADFTRRRATESPRP